MKIEVRSLWRYIVDGSYIRITKVKELHDNTYNVSYLKMKGNEEVGDEIQINSLVLFDAFVKAIVE